MIKSRPYLTVFFLLTVLSTNQLHAQQDSTEKKEKQFKNSVRFNISNPLLFGGKTIILSYERVLKDYQSISIDFGLLSLPKILPDTISISDSIVLSPNSTEKGFHTSVDYRFYLSKENKHKAPRGVYLAPYASYNYFNRKNTWALNTTNFQGDVTTDYTFSNATLGGELGYQFILWKRVAIDLILIGPGLSAYSIKTKLSTTLDADDEAELFKKINDVLEDKIPGYSIIIDAAEYEKTGSNNTTSIGFRYMVNIGFRF